MYIYTYMYIFVYGTARRATKSHIFTVTTVMAVPRFLCTKSNIFI